MANNLDAIQDAIAAHIKGLTHKVEEQAIPDWQTLERGAGDRVNTYTVYQFGDIQNGYTSSFAGARHGDYVLPIYTQTIGATPTAARKAANRVVDRLLGFTSTHTGEVRKRPGGGMWPLVSTTGATEAYMFPSSFGVLIQYE